jgi:formiminoglutamase
MSFKSIKASDFPYGNLPNDPRVISKIVDQVEKANVVVCGYPDDEGIKLNGGRIGANLAPQEIRKAFYKMTSGYLPEVSLFDAGNLDPSLSLDKKHQVAEKSATKFYELGKFMISLGGGHDYGYPDTQAFLNSFKNSKLKPVVINFDAHLDVRNLDHGLTSGTPFYRLLTANPKACHFFEIGIQEHCNSLDHIQWCKSQGGHIAFLSDLQKPDGLLKYFKNALKKYKSHPCFISVDIDSFSSSFAPGCSQSWPQGLAPDDFFPAFDFLFQQMAVKGIGLYEVSPPLDVQPLTSRLAALILYRCLKNNKWKGAQNEKPKRIRKR